MFWEFYTWVVYLYHFHPSLSPFSPILSPPNSFSNSWSMNFKRLVHLTQNSIFHDSKVHPLSFNYLFIYLFELWHQSLASFIYLKSLIPSHGWWVPSSSSSICPPLNVNFLEAKFTISLAQEAFWNLSFVWGVFEKEICHHQIRFWEPTQNVWHGSNSSFLVPLRFVYYFEKSEFH